MPFVSSSQVAIFVICTGSISRLLLTEMFHDPVWLLFEFDLDGLVIPIRTEVRRPVFLLMLFWQGRGWTGSRGVGRIE